MNHNAEAPVAVVTGGGKGIGRHIALGLAGAGLRVGVLGRSRDALQSVVDEIRGRGQTAEPVSCDVSSADEVAEAIGRIEVMWGSIDTVVCNAGIPGPIGQCEIDSSR